jgi:hypothetical protein
MPRPRPAAEGKQAALLCEKRRQDNVNACAKPYVGALAPPRMVAINFEGIVVGHFEKPGTGRRIWISYKIK